MMREHTFNSGEIIPVRGVYRIAHPSHRLPERAILLEDERFPTCAKCHGSVRFELEQTDPSFFAYEPLRVFELPVIPGQSS